MWSYDYGEVVLEWDAKCPFMRDAVPSEIQVYADRGCGPPGIEGYGGRVRTESTADRSLSRRRHDFKTLATADFCPGVMPFASYSRRLSSMVPDVAQPADGACALCLGAPYHMERTFRYSWSMLHAHLCLFAEYADGLFMPLPPLSVEPDKDTLDLAFLLMRDRNRGSAVTRIENVPEEWKIGWNPGATA